MDTQGKEKFRAVTSSSYHGVNGVFFVYSVADEVLLMINFFANLSFMLLVAVYWDMLFCSKLKLK